MLVNQITDEILTPLCDETRRLFRPLLISSDDRLHIKTQNKQFRLEARDVSGEYNGSYNSRVRFMDIIPGHNRVSERYITADATDLTCLLISYHWQPNQLLFEDDLAAATYHYRIANFVKQTARVSDRNNVDEFHILDSADLPLAHYQKIGVKASIGQEGFGLFMEQGTGKTAVAIARMCNEAAEKEQLYTMLVVCPAAVLLNWKQEIKRFASLPGRTTIIDGTKLDRFKKLTDAIAAHRDEYNKYTAAIISIDNVYSTKDILKIVPWDLCVLDESHNIKDQRTQRWQGMLELRDSCKQRMVLTGTPIANSLFDIWTQLEFMGDGWSGFSSFKKFKKFYGSFVKTGQQDKLVALKNLPMIQERLARQSYLIRKAEALPELPEKVYDIYQVEMTRDQQVSYRSLCETLSVEIEGILAAADESREVMTVNNILSMMLRLSQITSGFLGVPAVIDEAGNVVRESFITRFDPNPKVEAIVELLKDKEPHQKTIIWTNYVQNIKTLRARLEIEKIKAVTYYGETSKNDKNAAVTAFNEDPSTTVLIGNPAAGGVGLNLLGYPIGGEAKTWCDHVIYYSQDWSAIHRAQSEDRPHRRGTVHHVRYTDLVVPETIDEEIRMRVIDKRMSAFKIQDIRDVLSKIMRRSK